jgi:3D (Asp-Asp-Asp) domain-containing protein
MRLPLLAFAIVLTSASRLGMPHGSPAQLGVIGLSRAEASIPPAVFQPPRAIPPAAHPAPVAARPTGKTERTGAPRPALGRFKLTAYSGPQLGQAYPITATGTHARAGRTVAVDPKVIPLGSRIYIEGVGERIAEDVGGGVRGQHVDVYLPSIPQAVKFGVKRGRTVHLILPPKGRKAG